MHPVTRQVREQYERYPYPDYPWWFRPRTGEGWQQTSAFCRHLSNHSLTQGRGISRPIPPKNPVHVLVAGCGTMQPFLTSHWEGGGNTLHFLDLSRRSLLEARLRLRLRGLRHHWHCDDIEGFLRSDSLPEFDHFDLYGVLHHLADPEKVLRLLRQRAAPGATLRIMLYNSPARNWIHLIQELFSGLGLRPGCPTDLRKGREILRHLAKLPNLRDLLGAMRWQTEQEASLADTFFHPREIRLLPGDWIMLLQKQGFFPLGLFDRYGELDDLPNPLWQMPDPLALGERCGDRRFENNLEIFAASRAPGLMVRTGVSPLLYLCPPPLSWFQFRETRHMSLRMRWLIWHSFLQILRGSLVSSSLKNTIRKFPLVSLKRLARCGALLPGFYSDDPDFSEELSRPLAREMEIPDYERNGELPQELLCCVNDLLREQDAPEKQKHLAYSNLLGLLKAP